MEFTVEYAILFNLAQEIIYEGSWIQISGKVIVCCGWRKFVWILLCLWKVWRSCGVYASEQIQPKFLQVIEGGFVGTYRRLAACYLVLLRQLNQNYDCISHGAPRALMRLYSLPPTKVSPKYSYRNSLQNAWSHAVLFASSELPRMRFQTSL